MKWILSLFLICCYHFLQAQKLSSVTTYYDIEKKRKKAEYFISNDDSTLIQGEYILYYPTSYNIKKNIHYIMGKKEGICTEYHEGGNKKIQYSYKADKLHGEYKKFDRQGHLLLYCVYENGDIVGVMKKYKNNKLVSERFFENGKRNGKSYDYYPNGAIMRELYYKEDSLEGNSSVYDSLSQLIQKLNYKKNLLQGTITSFNKNGKIEKESYFDKGIQERVTKEYYESGKIKSIIPYKKGKQEGWVKAFYQNEKIKSKTEFLQGKPSGNIAIFYENGNKKFEIHNDSTELDTFNFIHFYANGVIKLQGTLVNSLLHRENISYYENGNIKQKHIYKHGKNTKTSEFYSKKGDKIKTIAYSKQGVARITVFFENKQIKISGEEMKGKKNGVWYYYTKKGNIEKQENYVMGVKEGSSIIYFLDSKQIKKINKYKKGLLEGVSKEYFPSGNLKSNYPYEKNILYGIVSHYFDEAGEKMKMKGKIYKNMKLGVWTYYDKTGNTIKTEIYKRGELIKVNDEK